VRIMVRRCGVIASWLVNTSPYSASLNSLRHGPGEMTGVVTVLPAML
jgi:hypothetical protein